MEDHLQRSGHGLEALDRKKKMTAQDVIEKIESGITRAAAINQIMGYKPPRDVVYPYNY